MRALISVVTAVLLTACLNSTHPAAQQAQTRHDIARAMRDDGGGAPPRKIVEVRTMTADRAVILTEQPDGGDASRRQETWVRGADGWKLEDAATATGDVGASGGS